MAAPFAGQCGAKQWVAWSRELPLLRNKLVIPAMNQFGLGSPPPPERRVAFEGLGNTILA